MTYHSQREQDTRLHISTATSSTCRIEDLEEIINRAYDVEKGCVGVAFQKAGADRISNPNSLIGDIEAGNFLILKNDIGELLGAIGYEMIQDSCSFGPFAVKHKGRGHGKLLLGELENLARKERKRYLTLVVVNHRVELMSMYEGLGLYQDRERSRRIQTPRYLAGQATLFTCQKNCN